MSFLNNIYHNALLENERNIRFWDEYLNNLRSLDFSIFSDKLKVPALVPLGSRILFRGELKHTNEVTVALGADYFVKCSLKQAEVLREHRIKGAQLKLDSFLKEKEHIESRLSFTKQNLYEDQGQEILEVHTEAEDKAWREKHRDNVKKYIQSKRKDEDKETDANDEELWERLEELELQEEMENEILENENKEYKQEESFVVKDEIYYPKDKEKIAKDVRNINAKIKEEERAKYTSKDAMLQKIKEKQNELEEKLLELRNKDRSKSKTEAELVSKVDEMEELEELEDEMDRLEDIIEDEDDSTEEETSTSSQTKLKKGVSFADEDYSETLELTFTHSSTEPNSDAYNPENGIIKPSDIYAAFPKLFSKTTSILKSSSIYNRDDFEGEITVPPKIERSIVFEDSSDMDDMDVPNPTIVVKDVIEKTAKDSKSDKTGPRPTSLFKQRRQQMKS